MTTFVGIDLAWGERRPTGLAVLDGDGSLLDVTSARTDAEIVAWAGSWTSGECLVAIDAPLVVTNPTGRRACEAELGAVFGRYDAGAHPTNTSRPEFAHGTRAHRLSARLGLDIDPASHSGRRAIEVYPHPATIALFGLDRTLKYKHKPGRDLPLLKAELLRLVRHLEGLQHTVPRLGLAGHDGWRRIRATVEAATRKSQLRAVEDCVDAVLCAYIALFADRSPERVTCFGDVTYGYIVTPSLSG